MDSSRCFNAVPSTVRQGGPTGTTLHGPKKRSTNVTPTRYYSRPQERRYVSDASPLLLDDQQAGEERTADGGAVALPLVTDS